MISDVVSDFLSFSILLPVLPAACVLTSVFIFWTLQTPSHTLSLQALSPHFAIFFKRVGNHVYR